MGCPDELEMATFERTRVKRSLRVAMRGSNSVKWTPGVLVGMTPKGPRYSIGASGFGSNVSNWLGAPQRKTNRTDFALGVSAAEAC